MTAQTTAQRKAKERAEKAAAGLVRLPDVWLPRWLAEWIDAQPRTRADVIERALIRAYRLKQPKE